VTRWQAASWTIAALVILVFAAANAHLIHVATTSQPSCVPHARLGDAGGGLFSAAQSACESPERAGLRQTEDRP
jgi:hypothetical protein